MVKDIRLLEDWIDPNKQEHKIGDFLRLDGQLADELVADGYAELKTAEQFEEEEADRLNKEASDARRKDRMAKKKTVVVVKGDRLTSSPTGGFKGFGHMFRDVVRASADSGIMSPELKAWNSVSKTAGHMNEADDSQGGYLVPAEFQANILATQLEASIVRQRATVIPMSTNRVPMPAVNDASHASSTHGGIIIYRPGEAEEKTVSKPTFGQVELTLHKLVGMIYVSDEMMSDSPISIEPMLNTMFGEALAFQEDDDYINGTGIGQPLGFTNAPCLVTVAIEGGQAADTIVAENIDKMWSRLHPTSMRNAVWLANNDCYPELASMARVVGTGGGPAYMPPTGLAGAPYGTLLGRPLILTEKMDTLGDGGDIAVCDFSKYLIGQKTGGPIQSASSMHFRFNYDEQTLRFVMRTDGQPSWLSALTPRYSTNTLSPFVTLAARP